MSYLQHTDSRGGVWQLLWLGVFRYCRRCADHDCPCDHVVGIRWPWGDGFAWGREWPIRRRRSQGAGYWVIFRRWRLGPVELRYIPPGKSPRANSGEGISETLGGET